MMSFRSCIDPAAITAAHLTPTLSPRRGPCTTGGAASILLARGSQRYDAPRMTRPRNSLVAAAAAMALLLAGYAGTPRLLRSCGLRRPRRGHEGGGTISSPTSKPSRSRRRRSPSRGEVASCADDDIFPSDISGRPILLVPGVHAAGIAEPRLINFAREIAATGHPVTTAELPDLAKYQITRAHDGHDRRRGHLAGTPRPARARRRSETGADGDQLRRGALGRRRLTHGRAGRVGAVLRRSRRPAACPALPVHRRAAERSDAPAARLRRGDHPSRRGRQAGARRSGGTAAPGDPGVPERLSSRHGRQAAGGTGIRARPQALGEPARAGANVHVVGQQPRRRPSRPGASASRRRARIRSRALGGPQSAAVGTRLSAARRRRQRDPGGGIRTAGRRSPRPRRPRDAALDAADHPRRGRSPAGRSPRFGGWCGSGRGLFNIRGTSSPGAPLRRRSRGPVRPAARAARSRALRRRAGARFAPAPGSGGPPSWRTRLRRARSPSSRPAAAVLRSKATSCGVRSRNSPGGCARR